MMGVSWINVFSKSIFHKNFIILFLFLLHDKPLFFLLVFFRLIERYFFPCLYPSKHFLFFLEHRLNYLFFSFEVFKLEFNVLINVGQSGMLFEEVGSCSCFVVLAHFFCVHGEKCDYKSALYVNFPDILFYFVSKAFSAFEAVQLQRFLFL